MSTAIVWFRQDLRLADNPSLVEAVSQHQQIIPLYIHSYTDAGEWTHSGASLWWLHHSLTSLTESLQGLGSDLLIQQGEAQEVLAKLVSAEQVIAIYWNRQYEPWAIHRDKQLKESFSEQGLEVKSFNAALINEPWTVSTKTETPYRVFTPYWKNCLAAGIDRPLLSQPKQLPALPKGLAGESIESLGLLDPINWHASFDDYWAPGEEGAHAALADFLEGTVNDYDTGRDVPGVTGTSRLSAHLHFGEISPRQVVAAVRREQRSEDDANRYVSEIGWREFAHHLLFHYPHTVDQPLNAKFEHFPWRQDYDDDLSRWQQGQTGIPLVDAGMRELWHTGWMHNRVRMVVASFLIKNLQVHWLEGARWFWDTLVDADLASNTMGWQWCAGSGADAAPYFRIFNPVTQGERFDGAGDYVRKWVPELAHMPKKFLHKPSLAPVEVLLEAGVVMDENYPSPMVDLKESRQRALDAYQEIKGLG